MLNNLLYNCSELYITNCRGGEGNVLWGKYFHDSSFDMKLTDIMFNMSYVAANCGSDIIKGGDIFKDEQLTANESGEITLSANAVPFSGSDIYAYVRKADSASDKRFKMKVEGNKVVDLDAGAAYCVRYLYNDNFADRLVVSSQFIPKTLYAVLTVALYAGDNTNPEAGTKVGKVVIKVPRFQLSGAMEISMTATGASQTALDGSALASGEKGCDGRGIYAEIIRVMDNNRWYDDASGLIIEDNYKELTVAEAKDYAPTVYAWCPATAPKMISNTIIGQYEANLSADEKSELVFSATKDGQPFTVDSKTGSLGSSVAAGTYVVTAIAKKGSEILMSTEATIKVVSGT